MKPTRPGFYWVKVYDPRTREPVWDIVRVVEDDGDLCILPFNSRFPIVIRGFSVLEWGEEVRERT